MDRDIITLARGTPIETELSRRGIRLKREGIEQVGPCPVCGGRDRFSFSPRKQIWNCRQCQTGGDVIDLVRFLDGCDFQEAIEDITGTDLGRQRKAQREASSPSPARPRIDPARIAAAKAKAEQHELDEIERQQNDFLKAMSIWEQSAPIIGTIAETYLTVHRKLVLPDGRSAGRPPLAISGDVLRFHPRCPFGKGFHPSLIGLIRNVITNAPQGIHRTALRLDGQVVLGDDGKKMKWVLGAVGNSAVKLSANEDVTMGLCISEGIETALAGTMMGYVPAWALINKGNIKSFPLLAGVEALTILADNDENEVGQDAAAECAERWDAAGREVHVRVAKQRGLDMADIVCGAQRGDPK